MFRPDELQTRLREQPFQPFRLIASEGLRYDIYHPDLLMVGQRDVTLGFPSDSNPRIYNRVIRIALIHLVGLEDLPIASNSGSVSTG